jgi:hypothetical protein
MITFFDGPAAGQVLACRRAPVFLRVVKSRTKWDALDQPGDTPNPGEHLYAYLLPGKPEWMHLRMSPRSLSGNYPRAQYSYLPDQPDQEVMRDAARWANWIAANGPRLVPAWAYENFRRWLENRGPVHA